MALIVSPHLMILRLRTSPAPWKRNVWSLSLVLVAFRAARTPATATLAVPYIKEEIITNKVSGLTVRQHRLYWQLAFPAWQLAFLATSKAWGLRADSNCAARTTVAETLSVWHQGFRVASAPATVALAVPYNKQCSRDASRQQQLNWQFPIKKKKNPGCQYSCRLHCC